MKKYLILIGILFLANIVVAQQNRYSYTFGNLTQHEKTMKDYELDKNADAIVIYELGDYYFQYNYDEGMFVLRKNKKIKIKILKQSGINYADFEIPLYEEGRKAELLIINDAVVYNCDEDAVTKTVLDRKKIFEEKISNNWIVKKFTMPNVKEGSIIELDYMIETPYFFNMGAWNFQKKIPVVYSKLRYRAIPYYEYSYLLKGASKFSEYSRNVINATIQVGNLAYQEVEFIFGEKNIPAFRDEEFITNARNYMISLNFQMSKLHYPGGRSKELMTTWPKMCDMFLKEDGFGKYIKSSEKEGKKIVSELSLGGLSKEEQIKKIVLYVKSNYSWDEYNGKFISEKLKDFLKNKKGNAANLNLFLTGLLQAANIDATPVVLGTRNMLSPSKFHPFEIFFNYVIVMVNVDGKKMFLDATEPLIYYAELPERCVNVEGLVVKPKSEEWVFIEQKNVAMIERDFVLTPVPEESRIAVDVIYTLKGQAAYNYRNIYAGKEENLLQYLKKANNIDAKLTSVKNLDNLDYPFIITFSFNIPLEKNNDKLFMTPFSICLNDNPFKQTSRTHPVDLMYVRGEKNRTIINIPTDYKINFLPSNQSIDNAILSMKYNIATTDTQIEVNSEYTYKQSIYQPTQYRTLQSTVSEIVKKFSEMIILETK